MVILMSWMRISVSRPRIKSCDEANKEDLDNDQSGQNLEERADYMAVIMGKKR